MFSQRRQALSVFLLPMRVTYGVCLGTLGRLAAALRPGLSGYKSTNPNKKSHYQEITTEL
jgi:hypothetical protein